MDLSFHPPASEYDKQGTGAHFTIRSANSPSYSLTRRTVKSLSFLEDKGERPKEVRKSERCVMHAGPNGTNKEEDTFAGDYTSTGGHSGVKSQCEMKGTQLNQNGTADKTITHFDTDRRGNPAFKSHGRKKYSRTMSLDRRTGARSPDSSAIASMSMLSAKGKKAAELEERRTGAEGVRSKVMSSVQANYSAGASYVIQERSPVSHVSQTLDRANRGYSFPTRFRSLSGSNSTETSSGPKGKTILERIEKLYGSAGVGKAEDNADMPQQKSYKRAEGGTFPRRFSSGEGDSNSPGKTIPWTPQKERGLSRRSSGGQWQEQLQGRPEDGGLSWGRGLKDIGTRSLDRARSRNTAAALIKDSQISNLREKKNSASKNQSRVNNIEDIVESEGRNGPKVPENEAKENTELKSSNSDDDVFKLNSQKVSLKTTERNKLANTLPSSTAASVRNKINQFEALTQRAQSSVPRRALSVPAQLSKRKMSGSARALGGLRDKWEGVREGEDSGDKSRNKVAEAETKLWAERSISMDGGGLRFGRKEREVKDLVQKEGAEQNGSNNRDDHVGKYSEFKRTLQIPLNGGSQRSSGNCYIDETDFSKVLSPEEANKAAMAAKVSAPVLLSGSDSVVEQKTKPYQVSSPVKDDGDKTPTNTPNHSPFLSPATKPETAPPIANTHDSTPVRTPDPDPAPLPRPLATSSHSNLQNLTSPQVSFLSKARKRAKDLDAWVAGLDSEISVWNNEEEDDEDDDESTQKDEDSNYDSDSGESSVTITSNMSQSDRRSFCVSLSDLCNFAGADEESENDSDEWQSTGRRSVSLCSDVSALSCVSVMPSEELDRLLEDVKSLGDNTLQDYNDVQVVVLHKEMGVGLGFSLAGGVDQNKPVTVHKVFHSGVAAQEGTIREGDQVLSINGTALSGCAHWEALRVLRRVKSRDMGVVVLRRGIVSGVPKVENKQGSAQLQFFETGQQVCVCLEKNSRDLGFTLEGGVGSSLGNRPLTVQKIFQGGPVDKVFPGDEVLEIEGVSTLGMSRLEVWTFIRKLPPGPVNVVLQHPLKNLET